MLLSQRIILLCMLITACLGLYDVNTIKAGDCYQVTDGLFVLITKAPAPFEYISTTVYGFNEFEDATDHFLGSTPQKQDKVICDVVLAIAKHESL